MTCQKSDYNSGRLIIGGYLAEVPQPYQRYWPNESQTRRRVSISIMRFYGQGPHYYATLREENNPIWDASEYAWRVARDDQDAKGRVFNSPRSRSYHWITVWIEKMIKKYFQPISQYEIDTSADYTNEPVRWFYREGD